MIQDMDTARDTKYQRLRSIRDATVNLSYANCTCLVWAIFLRVTTDLPRYAMCSLMHKRGPMLAHLTNMQSAMGTVWPTLVAFRDIDLSIIVTYFLVTKDFSLSEQRLLLVVRVFT